MGKREMNSRNLPRPNRLALIPRRQWLPSFAFFLIGIAAYTGLYMLFSHLFTLWLR